MKKKILILAMCGLMLAGCGTKKSQLEYGNDSVASIDNEVINAQDLYEELKNSYGLELLLNKIDKTILEKEYPDDLSAATTSAENTINQLKEYYGDKLLSTIQYYTSYNTVEEYQASLYLNYLQDLAVTDYAKTQITDKEIKAYYKSDIVGDIKVSHILITVDTKDGATDDEKTAAENAAKTKAEEVISKLKDAKDIAATFTELAKEYSNDDSTKENGGDLGFINKDTLGDSYKDMVTAAYALKDGAYTTEPVKTELGYHIVLRTETKDKASLDDVRDSIIETLATNYKTNHSDASIKAMQELRKKYNLDFADTELKDAYAKYIQSALQQAQTASTSSSSSTSSN